jgi:hypothetical protein
LGNVLEKAEIGCVVPIDIFFSNIDASWNNKKMSNTNVDMFLNGFGDVLSVQLERTKMTISLQKLFGCFEILRIETNYRKKIEREDSHHIEKKN